MRITSDYQIGRFHEPAEPTDARRDAEDVMAEMAHAEAQDELKNPLRVAEVFDAGGSVAYMPQQLAQLVALAAEVPDGATTVTAKLYEAIGMRFVEWVGDTLTNLALEDIRARREA